MKKLLKLNVLMFSTYCFIECSGQSVRDIQNSDYIKNKSRFDTTFIKHFPKTIETKLFLTVINNSPKTNKVSFYLFEFGVSEKALDSLSQIGKLKSQVSYNWKDSCLFIVHPNETIDPFDEESFDKIDRNIDCLTKKTPIPNFVDIKSPNSKHGISMDSTFNIFVLESKAEKCSQYDMLPLKSMPRTWENGFSRGFALSKENGVVIYWMIIW